jgi:hypothetical protein
MEIMKKAKFWMVIPALLIGGAVGLASAKLPAPTEEAKAAAAAKKAKAAEAAKKAAEALAKAQDRAVANYKGKGGGKAMTTSTRKK